MNDIYDEAISYLQKNTDRILDIWNEPNLHPSGILFLAASPSGTCQRNEDNNGICGDICEIKSQEAVAYSSEITELIHGDVDKLIPLIDDSTGLPDIKADMLNSFAEWQRMFDLEWDRNPIHKLHEWGFEPIDLKTSQLQLKGTINESV